MFALALACGCASEPSASSEPSERRAPRRGGRTVQPIDSELDLQAMLSTVPEYEGQGRNLFIYGPEPPTRSAAPPPPPTRTSPTRPPAPTTAPRQAPRPSTRSDVRYAGFVEKTTPAGGKAKYAIFLDGNEILAGAEGETVANRFTVIEIGLESVTVSAGGSSATQRIPLQAN